MHTHPKLTGFPVVVAAEVAWGEMDSFAHLNNVVYFRYFENARIAYLTQVGWFDLLKTDGLGPIVASTHCRFRRPITYPDPILIGARVITVETDRVTFEHRLFSTKWDDVAAEGQAVVVCYNYHTAAKATIPNELRMRIDGLERS
jgi:acyl-CoA thioester hydrolase